MKNILRTLERFELSGKGPGPTEGRQAAHDALPLSNHPVPARAPANQPGAAKAITSRTSGTVLYVSTGLKHFEMPDTAEYPNILAKDVTIEGMAFRRLDGQYFAWLLLLKASIDRKQPRPPGWAALHAAWGDILGWAGARCGVAALAAAVDDMNRADFVEKYQPPVVAWDRYERVGVEGKSKLKGICERQTT